MEDTKKSKETETVKPKTVLLKENIVFKEESFIIADFNSAQIEVSRTK